MAAIKTHFRQETSTEPKKLVKSQQTSELWHNSFWFHKSLTHFAPDKAYEVKCWNLHELDLAWRWKETKKNPHGKPFTTSTTTTTSNNSDNNNAR